ncbi:MAG TPA: PIG-L family deacetylase [Bryobacteraceae bacterium]|nr:PIG-L family deacetylase [Bryobacteraceae bacterium]
MVHLLRNKGLGRRQFLTSVGALASFRALAQTPKLRIIAFGAHPDDCDIRVGGTAALWSRMGHAVKFVACTNGDAGHPVMGGAPLARRRRAEATEAGRRLGVTYDILEIHDGELMPTLENRNLVIQKIREWNADLVLGPRPNDYHPDHRYTGVLVQDSAYMVVVPAVLPNIPPLKRNPVFLFYEDRFRKPTPFQPDIVVDLQSVWDQKVDGMDAHESQFYEFQTNVNATVEVPTDKAERKRWLSKRRTPVASDAVRTAAAKWYGKAAAEKAPLYYEAFEICEYGGQPDEARIRELFPMLPKR